MNLSKILTVLRSLPLASFTVTLLISFVLLATEHLVSGLISLVLPVTFAILATNPQKATPAPKTKIPKTSTPAVFDPFAL
jgi:hypothetical protein